MPRITFMIGNGFDRQLGLDTRYDQFLEWYIKQPSQNDNIDQYKADLSRDRSSQWWSDAEIAMGEHLGGFNSETIDNYYERVRDFKIKLGDYLKNQEEKCDFTNAKIIGDRFARFLLNYQNDIFLKDKVRSLFSIRHSMSFNFINFNYTNTLKQLVELTKSTRDNGRLYENKINSNNYAIGELGQVVPIHGTLDSSIIMGVNDESQLAVSPDLLSTRLKRTLIKQEINTALGRKEDTEGTILIRSSDIIAVFGLKLGETDKKWRDLIAEWLNDKNHIIVVFGHKKKENLNRLIPEDTLDYVDEKQTCFLNKLFTDNDQEKTELFRNQIYIIDKTNYLDFSIIKKNN